MMDRAPNEEEVAPDGVPPPLLPAWIRPGSRRPGGNLCCITPPR